MEFDSIIYHDPDAASREPRKGEILVSSPFLKEYFFSRSVILLLDSSEEGGQLGLVLNKRAKVSLADLFPQLADLGRIEVFCGGPVGRDRLFMLHSLPEVFTTTLEVCPGVYVGGSPEEIVHYLLNGGTVEGHVRFFLGYSGWMRGQLIKEIRHQSWACAVPRASGKLLLGKGDAYWRRAVESLGPNYHGWLNVPDDPSLN